MSLFTVDQEKCIRCGACSEVCPLYLIEIHTDKGPSPVDGEEDSCINCGHCVSVCPSSAFSLATMPLENCPPMEKDLKLTKAQAEQFLRSRRSIRCYKEDIVPKDTIKELIELARYAPTGHNLQPVSWKIIYSRDEVVKLKNLVIDWMKNMHVKKPEMAKALNMEYIIEADNKGLDVVLRSAPHLIIAHGLKDDRTCASSCRIAMSYLDLSAQTFELGTCWAGFLDIALMFWKPLQDALELPEDQVSSCSMMIGCPVHSYHRMPLRKEPTITWK